MSVRNSLENTRDPHSVVAMGRGALARRERFDVAAPGVSGLLALLWHGSPDVRRQAALGLCGGTHGESYTPCYGHFAANFLRELERHCPRAPVQAQSRYEAVGVALCRLLEQNAGEIRAMGNMHYSFLGSALYLALFATCRDTVEAIRRLRVIGAQGALSSLLWQLAHVRRAVRINASDVDFLTQTVGRALASFPPDAIPDYWRTLTYAAPHHRASVTPALPFFTDARAVPYLIAALAAPTPRCALPIVAALTRLADPRALPTLAPLLAHRKRALRHQARAAIAAIRRAEADRPSQTLLRSVVCQNDEGDLLRALPGPPPADPPDELLRVPEPPA